MIYTTLQRFTHNNITQPGKFLETGLIAQDPESLQDLEDLHKLGIIMKTKHKVALTVQGCQILQKGSASHLWVHQFLSGPQSKDVTSMLASKYRVSHTGQMVQDHFQNWLVLVLAKDKIGKELDKGGMPATGHLKRWAFNATRDDIRKESRNPVYRSLWKGMTETDLKKLREGADIEVHVVGNQDSQMTFSRNKASSASNQSLDGVDISLGETSPVVIDQDIYKELHDRVVTQYGQTAGLVFFSLVKAEGQDKEAILAIREKTPLPQEHVQQMIRTVREYLQPFYQDGEWVV